MVCEKQGNSTEKQLTKCNETTMFYTLFGLVRLIKFLCSFIEISFTYKIYSFNLCVGYNSKMQNVLRFPTKCLSQVQSIVRQCTFLSQFSIQFRAVEVLVHTSFWKQFFIEIFLTVKILVLHASGVTCVNRKYILLPTHIFLERVRILKTLSFIT